MWRFFALAATLGILAPANGLAGPLGITDDRKAKDLLIRAGEIAKGVVGKAGDEARITLSHATNGAQILIDSISAAVGSNVDLTFKKLDKQQQEAFRDLDRLLENLEFNTVNPTIETANDISNRAFAVASRVAVWANTPAVLEYWPLFHINSGAVPQSIQLTISGINLHRGNSRSRPVAVIGSERLDSTVETEGKLKFIIPTKFIPPQADVIQRIPIELQIPVSGWLSTDWYKFRLVIEAVPEIIGSVRLDEVVKDAKIEYQWKFTCERDPKTHAPRVVTFKDANPKNLLEVCPPIVLGGKNAQNASGSRVPCIIASDGWTLEPLQAQVVRDIRQGWFKCKAPDSRYNAGKVEKTNDGLSDKVCFLASVGATESSACARTEAQFRVREKRDVVTEVSVPSKDVKLAWGKRTPLNFDDREAVRRTLTITVLGQPEKVYAVDQSTCVGPIAISPDIRNRRVFIEVVDPNQGSGRCAIKK
jgi:hypothetical protein